MFLLPFEVLPAGLIMKLTGDGFAGGRQMKLLYTRERSRGAG